jgi:hypothetical protein
VVGILVVIIAKVTLNVQLVLLLKSCGMLNVLGCLGL